MAGKYDLRIEQGATYEQTFTMSSGGAPINLTGYAIRMQVRPFAGDTATPILEATTSNGMFEITNATNGEFRLTLSATVTNALPPSAFVYDLELVNGNIVTRLLEGNVFISPNVTR